jgi:hypothetical protein
MPCEECTRIQAEVAFSWQAYLVEKRSNQSHHREQIDVRLKHQEDLLQAYKLSAARQRVHRGTVHPEEGHVVRFQDLRLLSGQEADA